MKEIFRLSWTKIDLFCQCPRCFYLDRKHGISHPPGASFTLNKVVDTLLKKEFDTYREQKRFHPFFSEFGIDATLFAHPELGNWRNNRIGIQHLHSSTNCLLYGAIDDIWQLPSGELVIVDYKAKATDKKISLESKKKRNGEMAKSDGYLLSYRRQVEFYQWLFRRNGFQVSRTAYFVVANAQKNRPSFNNQLNFEKVLIPYEGDDSWVELTIEKIALCLQSDSLPNPRDECKHCHYRMKAQQIEESVSPDTWF